ncbi:MAG TPA: cupredoxin domain-containing protein [Nitriliruptorales bacterium]|nr:cupredoxin domain-containing protein [Nitriliruptorales bacterium]
MTPQRTSATTAIRPYARRAALPLGAAAAAAVLAACGSATPASGDVRPGAADGDAIQVIAVDNNFAPAVLKLEAGEPVTIELRNDGDTPHNLVIDDLDVSTGTLEPGDVVTATFTAPRDPARFVCTFHPGMAGEIRVAAG